MKVGQAKNSDFYSKSLNHQPRTSMSNYVSEKEKLIEMKNAFSNLDRFLTRTCVTSYQKKMKKTILVALAARHPK